MANVYVRSGAGGAGTGADWANAYTTAAAALAAKAAGDDFWVSEDHAESQASAMTLTAPGTSASPNRILCVDHTGSVPPVAADLRTTATITTTGNNAMTIGQGVAYVYGITFNCGSGAVNAALSLSNAGGTQYWHFKECVLAKLGTTGIGSAITIGASGSNVGVKIVLENTQLKFGASGDSMLLRSGMLHWRDTASPLGGTSPTSLFAGTGTLAGVALLERLDLSGFSGTIFSGGSNPAATRQGYLRDCRTHASATLYGTPTVGPASAEYYIYRADSAGTNYRVEKGNYMGADTVETTIVRTGGSSHSRKIVTTANDEYIFPFESLALDIWCGVVGSVTYEIYCIWGGGAVPTQDEVWSEAYYLGSGSHPLASVSTTGKANVLATAGNQASDGSTWGGSTTAFKFTHTFTTGQAGYVRFVIKVAKVSTTVYVDERPVKTA